MNTVVALVLGFAICTEAATQTPQPPPHTIGLTSTRDLAKYVGTYPCDNGLLHQRVLLSAIRNVVGDDYPAYREHIKLSGCGAIEKRHGFLLMDVSQLHVGGYTSLIFVRLGDGAVFVFWLKSTVADKQWKFYGQRPIPAEVSQIVESELNSSWGHVAHFSVDSDRVEIVLHHPK